jgi:hypothetical protein
MDVVKNDRIEADSAYTWDNLRSECLVGVCNVKNVLERVIRRDEYSMKKTIARY